jgi:hypothetical protein
MALAGCGGTQQDFVFTGGAGPAPAGRVMAVYMVGSDLESGFDAASDDLLEMVDGLTSLSAAEREELSLIVAFGGADKDGWQGVKWMNEEILLQDAANQVFGDLPPGSYLFEDASANMADPTTLTSFLGAVQARNPQPEARFVILWNHGAGYSGYGYDENARAILSLADIDSAFALSGLPRLELLGFDACLMASVEVTSALDTRARYMVASEETEPGHGWNYRYVVPNYLRIDSIADYGIGLVDNYVDDASHDEASDGKTLSLLDLDQTDSLVQALNAYGASYAADLGTQNEVTIDFVRSVVAAQSFGVRVDGRHSIDLRDFVRRSTAFSAAQPATTEALEQAIDGLVVYANDDGSLDNVNGLGLVPPDLNSQKLAPQAFPSSGWLALTNSSLALMASDLSPPLLSDLMRTAEGILATFVDPLLVRVSSVNGWQSEGTLTVLESSPAQPQGEANRWLAPVWDGQAYHLLFDPQLPAQPLPITFSRTVSSDEGELDLYLIAVEFRAAGEADQDFKPGTMTLAIQDGEVEDYQIQTYQTGANGQQIEDRTIEALGSGDQLRIFAVAYREGSQFDFDQRPIAQTITVAGPPSFARQAVVAPAGSSLSFAIMATDFAGQTTVSPFQSP